MLKSAVFLIIFSILAVLFKTQLAWVLHELLILYNQIADGLGTIFSLDSEGRLIQAIITLLLIPIIFGTLLAVILWLFKRQSHMHIIACVWVVWTVMLVTLLAQGV